jgi:putative addiction module CopG family antidote
MAHALASENEQFIRRMIRQGRFNNQSEVVREALRRMEREETSYLNPPPLTEAEAERIFAPNPAQDTPERLGVRHSNKAIRRLIRQKELTLKDL